MPDAASTPTTDPPKGTLTRLGELAWQALPAVAGAIGVLGFVALVGGGIEWVRFWSAGLPADQAVRAMPREELVTIGAVSLVGFMVAGLLVVLILYVLDSDGSATSINTLRGLFGLAVVEMLATLLYVDRPWGTLVLVGIAFVVVGVLAYRALADVPQRLRERDERKAIDEALREAWESFRSAQDRYDDAWFQVRPTPGGNGEPEPGGGQLVALRQATLLLRRARRDWQRALANWEGAAPAGQEVRREQAARSLRSGTADEPPPEAALDSALAPAPAGAPDLKRVRAAWPACVAAALLAAYLADRAAAGDIEWRLLTGVLIVVVLLTAANFALARATQRFAWYGLGALMSLILFGAALNIGRTILDPKVQPLALIRKSDQRPLCGVYVTETDKRIYVGRVVKDEGRNEFGSDAGSGRMFWIPSADVDVVSIGPLQAIEDAEVRARLLTNEVLGDRPQKAAPAAKPIVRTTVRKISRPGHKRSVEKSVTDVAEVPLPEKAALPPAKPGAALPGDDFTPCATTPMSEARVDKLKPAARRIPARHRQAP
jgi:hypothetical protein